MNKLACYLKDIAAPAATMAMISAAHAPFDLAFLAFIAYVPLVMGFISTDNRRRFAVCTVVMAIGFWLFNIYWLINIIAIGWIGASILMGLFSLILLRGLSVAIRQSYPFWLTLPITVAGIEFLYGLPFGGFQWHLLGHTLYRQTMLIQIADITGVAGVSFAVAMVNGIVCDILHRKGISGIKTPITVCIAVFIGIIAYGYYRIETETKNFQKGPLIAAIQPNIPSAVKEDKYEGFAILENLFWHCEQALKTGAELLVMPETIISSAVNPDFLDYTATDSEPRRYARALHEFAADRAYLLTGATSLKVGDVDGTLKVTNQYNSAFLYSPDGFSAPQRYDKIHLVPFGEYIPPRDIEWIRRLFLRFNPYDYDYTLTAGEELTRFEANIENQDWDFSVIICYEDTDAELTRRLSYSKSRGKADWVLNISNDGWYVWYVDGRVKPSIELAQRTAISAFRAVENRITLIRSVNTGISCKIDPLGRIVDGYHAGTLPEKAFDRQAVEGWFAARPCITPTITVFAKYGTVFSKLCAAALIVLIMPVRRKI